MNLQIHDRRRLAGAEGTLKRIVINKHNVRANLGKPEGERMVPVVSIQTSRGPFTVGWCEVDGPSKVVYRPDAPLSCGASVWIETTARLVWGD